eukprot:NODE_4086_length_712_cov_103.343988.p1 GENE.NODE_4086_length_712_cov_103.343988~~NODE_4086_length_712_cov_103.343988.p1  ORF type:complete len:179 (+),score=39.35 NODE_4086_length_712_cov_103.343988:3-539(+)
MGGGLIALNAFGLEERVPGVWLDSAIFRLRDEFAFHLQRFLPRPISALVFVPAWGLARLRAGVRIDAFEPERTLLVKHGQETPVPRRHVAVAHNDVDDLVPASQSRNLLEFLRKLPGKPYEVQELLFGGTCAGRKHCVQHLLQTTEYPEHICAFWNKAFGISHGCAAGAGAGKVTGRP